ncbi:MAG: hypothetical protein ABEK59_11785 [Halobacteria archaeon]
MTYSQSSVENTVQIGGNLVMRVFELDITNYDDDSGSDGESFGPADANMRRFVEVRANVMYEEGGATTVQKCVAQYDYANNAIRLLQQSDSGSTDSDAELVEVPSNSDEGVKVRVVTTGVGG